MSDKNPFDFSEMFKQFDPAEMTRQFQKAFDDSPFAQMQSSDFAETQRKNMEALTEAQQTAVNGARKIMKSQAEMLQAAMAEASAAMQSITESGSGELPKKNAEAVEKAFNQSIENFEEITAMVESLYKEVSSKVEAQVAENLQQLKDNLSKINAA